jgi:teichuronic acid exporter
LEQSTLKKGVLLGVYWSAIEAGGRNLLRVIFGLILARLLEPGDYGLIGMITIFITLAGVIVDSGLSLSLIQDQNSGDRDFSTIFFFNIATGLVFYIIMFFSAPLIAAFFDQPILIKIIRFCSLNFVFSSFGIVQNSLFSKHMDFKILMKISLISIFISGSVGILMAFLGFGVWSLVTQGLIFVIINSCLLWFFSEWKPTLTFDRDSLKRHFSFGSKLMYANVISTIFQNVYLIIIGKIYSARDLGFYTKSESVARTPVQNVYSIFQKVFFPALSLIQNDNIRLKAIFKKSLKVSGFIVFPVMLGLLSVSKPFILILLTDKWSGSIPYLQLLCLTYLLYPFHAINLNILNVKGRSDLVLKLEYFKKGIIILAILLTFKLGIFALIIGQLLSSVIAFFINSYYSGKLIDYPIFEQMSDLLPYFVLSVFMALVIYIPVILLGEKHLFQILIQVSFGTLFYLGVSGTLKFTGYLETRDIVKQYASSLLSGGRN